MAAHSGFLPWTEEPGELQSGGHKELDMNELLSMHTHTHTHDICKANVFFDGERLKAFPLDEKQGKDIFFS